MVVGDPPAFIELKLPFTASPYYDYLDNFLAGLKMNAKIPSVTNCIDSIIYTMDDYAYFENNITL